MGDFDTCCSENLLELKCKVALLFGGTGEIMSILEHTLMYVSYSRTLAPQQIIARQMVRSSVF